MKFMHRNRTDLCIPGDGLLIFFGHLPVHGQPSPTALPTAASAWRAAPRALGMSYGPLDASQPSTPCHCDHRSLCAAPTPSSMPRRAAALCFAATRPGRDGRAAPCPELRLKPMPMLPWQAQLYTVGRILTRQLLTVEVLTTPQEYQYAIVWDTNLHPESLATA